jgi:4-amino-4-deoxy-L-arabinose transferase-like glycosyltransferase
MLLWNKNLSKLQRRSVAWVGACTGTLVFIFLLKRELIDRIAAPESLLYVFAVLPAVPIGVMMIVAGRYIARETDEFVRMVVMQGLLWSFGVTLVTVIVMGGLSAYVPQLGRLLPLAGIDLFVIVAAVAIRTQLRSAQ